MSKVSIVIPCYNDGKYLLKTLESALNQTHKDCEIIVVDDHSSDPHTQSVLKSLGHRVKLITVPPGKKGVSAARNLGISQAEGEYILPLDADDLIDPTYIEKACRILDNNPNIGVCYCQAAYFGLKKGRWKLPPYSFETLLLRNMIFVSALFRKQLWEQASGFDKMCIWALKITFSGWPWQTWARKYSRSKRCCSIIASSRTPDRRQPGAGKIRRLRR